MRLKKLPLMLFSSGLAFILAAECSFAGEKSGKGIKLSGEGMDIKPLSSSSTKRDSKLPKCPANPEDGLRKLQKNFENCQSLYTANKEEFEKFLQGEGAHLVIASEQITLTKGSGGMITIQQMSIFAMRGDSYLVGKDVCTALKPAAKKILALGDYYRDFSGYVSEAEGKDLPARKAAYEKVTEELDTLMSTKASNAEKYKNSQNNAGTGTGPGLPNYSKEDRELDKKIKAAKKEKEIAEKAYGDLQKDVEYSKKILELISAQIAFYGLDANRR